MFSATKFVVAGVIVALFGGLLLISLPLESTREGVPGVASDGPSTFSPAGTLAVARAGHTATLLPDGRVLVVGGHWEPNAASAEVWDPTTASFGPAGSLVHARGGHTATLLPDGRVLIVGGCCDPDAKVAGEHTVLEAEIWDPGTASFEPAGTLSEGREELHTATLLPDGSVLIVGGLRIYGVAMDETAEIWDPTTASFGPPITLDPSRAGHTATLLPDGRVLLFGGSGFDPRTEQEVEAPAQIWDPETAVFEPADGVFQGRAEHTALLLPDGRVLLIGGYGMQGRVPMYSTRPPAEIWDPVTASVEPAGAPVEGGSRHTATLLPDGRVLVVGGGPDDLASAEIRDPATASFGPAGSLAEGREGHTATLLQDGRVLIVGGELTFDAAPPQALASAEVWTPGER